MSKVDVGRLESVAGKLRKRAQFFLENDPQGLTQEDFSVISQYLENLADNIDDAVKSRKGLAFLRGFIAFLIYLTAFVGSCYVIFMHSPFADAYYVKLAKEIFDQAQDVALYVDYIKIGIALFCSLFIFFVSIFVSIILCTMISLINKRLMNAIVESLVTSGLAAGLVYAYYKYVFLTQIAKTFL